VDRIKELERELWPGDPAGLGQYFEAARRHAALIEEWLHAEEMD
jgi:hypothetical protein